MNKNMIRERHPRWTV